MCYLHPNPPGGWSYDVVDTCGFLDENAYKNIIYWVLRQGTGKNGLAFRCEFERKNCRCVDVIPWLGSEPGDFQFSGRYLTTVLILLGLL